MRSLLFCILVLSLLSCDRYPDPHLEVQRQYNFLFQNWYSHIMNENDTINVTMAESSPFPGDEEELKVNFKIVKGGGSVSQDSDYFRNGNVVATDWVLGSESCEQVLRADIFNSAGKFLTSSSLLVYALRTDNWDSFPIDPGSRITGLVADTVNKLTFMIENNRVYRQGAKYYLWNEVIDEDLNSSRTIHIDSNEVLYVSTWNGDVVKSIDHGQSWIKCIKPYPDSPYNITFYVSNDNYLWASRFGYPVKYSADGGQTWKTAGNLMQSGIIDEIYRLKDGSLLYHGSDCCSLNRTSDYGETVQSIVTPGYSLKLFVNEKDEIFIGTQDYGWSTYKSSDMGLSFELVNRVNPTFGGYMGKIYHKKHNFYYILAQGYGVLKSYDLVHYELLWYNQNILNLYLDHNGVLFATTYNGPMFYRKSSD